MIAHAHRVFVHQEEEGHGADVLPRLPKVGAVGGVHTVVEEGVEVDDVRVWGELAKHLILVLEFLPRLRTYKQKKHKSSHAQ